jgi:hypothetical protein
VLQGIRSSLLRLHTLRLEAAVKLAIADFRSYYFYEDKLSQAKESVKHLLFL